MYMTKLAPVAAVGEMRCAVVAFTLDQRCKQHGALACGLDLRTPYCHTVTLTSPDARPTLCSRA